MITDSYYWKEHLLKGAAEIAKIMPKETLTETQFSRVEREILIGFYSVRKLIEATTKVTPKTAKLELELNWYPKRADKPRVDWYNRYNFIDLYDFNEFRVERRDIIFISHRMVHSYIFNISNNGVLFNSDRDKERRLLFIKTTEILRAFNTVGDDYPSSIIVTRDPLTGDRIAEACDEEIEGQKAAFEP